MSETRHTPGPFTCSGGRYIGICAKIDGKSRQIGRAEIVGHPGVISGMECESNAALFAAAPDLLAALKLYVDHFGDPLKVAVSAIAKAEGRQ